MNDLGRRPPTSPPAGPDPVPGVWRRLACLLYEGVLLFGIVMIAALLYGALTQQRHALVGMLGLQATVFGVVGLYFVGFWSRYGQTLAMRTWRMRIVGPDGLPPSWLRATARYLLAWLWFLPALAATAAAGLTSGAAAAGITLAGVAGYALVARLHPSRQFLHDLICGTRLVHWEPPRHLGAGQGGTMQPTRQTPP